MNYIRPHVRRDTGVLTTDSGAHKGLLNDVHIYIRALTKIQSHRNRSSHRTATAAAATGARQQSLANASKLIRHEGKQNHRTLNQQCNRLGK